MEMSSYRPSEIVPPLNPVGTGAPAASVCGAMTGAVFCVS
jgi:hypothetical protein